MYFFALSRYWLRGEITVDNCCHLLRRLLFERYSQVGDPDAAAQRLADAEASSGKGSLSARSYRSVMSTRAGEQSDSSQSDDGDYTGDEVEIVLESGVESEDDGSV